MSSNPLTPPLSADERPAQDPPGQRRHKLKCDAAVFDAVWDGSKNFEFRLNDRDYRVGDVLELRECRNGASGQPMETGRVCVRGVSYILHGGLYGVPPGYCVMALRSRCAAAEPDRVDAEPLTVERAEAMLQAREPDEWNEISDGLWVCRKLPRFVGIVGDAVRISVNSLPYRRCTTEAEFASFLEGKE